MYSHSFTTNATFLWLVWLIIDILRVYFRIELILIPSWKTMQSFREKGVCIFIILYLQKKTWKIPISDSNLLIALNKDIHWWIDLLIAFAGAPMLETWIRLVTLHANPDTNCLEASPETVNFRASGPEQKLAVKVTLRKMFSCFSCNFRNATSENILSCTCMHSCWILQCVSRFARKEDFTFRKSF